MAHLNYILGQIKGIAKVSKNKAIERKINDQWDVIAGQMGSQLTVDFYRDGILFLIVDNPVWRSEIEFIKPILFNQLIQFVGGGIVKEIKVNFVVAAETAIVSEIPLESRSLQDVVTMTNRQRIADGMRLCSLCGSVYTHGEIGVFCRCQS